jgi:hypothetical protein
MTRRRAFAQAVPVWLAVAFAVGVGGCSRVTHYSADPLTARIVDADSGAPLPGVNVVAGWEMKGGLEGGNVVGWVMVMEAVSDAEGKISFPGWGPKEWDGGGGMGPGSPLLLLFKSGYEFQQLYDGNYRVTDHPHGNVKYTRRGLTSYAHMHSYWDGKTIELKKSDRSLQEYAQRLAFLDIKIGSLLNNNQCNWKAIPRFLWAVEVQNRVFAASEGVVSLAGLSRRPDKDGQCGSLKAYVEAYGK